MLHMIGAIPFELGHLLAATKLAMVRLDEDRGVRQRPRDMSVASVAELSQEDLVRAPPSIATDMRTNRRKNRGRCFMAAGSRLCRGHVVFLVANVGLTSLQLFWTTKILSAIVEKLGGGGEPPKKKKK